MVRLPFLSPSESVVLTIIAIGFIPPRGSLEILDFIADSQRRGNGATFFSPIAEQQSPPRYTARASSPPTPISLFLQELAGSSSPPRVALTSKTTNRLLKTSIFPQPEEEIEAPSPFTALPTKLNLKFNKSSSRLLNQVIPDSPRKIREERKVNLEFLGGKEVVELKRVLDFENARKKLEGERELVGQGVGFGGESFARLVIL